MERRIWPVFAEAVFDMVQAYANVRCNMVR
jgi:hypothetical protein